MIPPPLLASEWLSSVEVVGLDEFEPSSDPPECATVTVKFPAPLLGPILDVIGMLPASFMFKLRKLPFVKTLCR